MDKRKATRGDRLEEERADLVEAGRRQPGVAEAMAVYHAANAARGPMTFTTTRTWTTTNRTSRS